MRRKADLEAAAADAADLLWYYRHWHGGRSPEGQSAATAIEQRLPTEVARVRSGDLACERLEGRVEALRWMADERYPTLDAEGILDS